MKLLTSFIVASYLLVGTPTAARADVVYQSDSDGIISKFDTATVATTSVGTTTVGTIDGLAFSPSGVLYGIRDNLQTQNAHLYTIDVNTGAATLVGQTGIPLAEGLAFGLNGTLYTMSGGNLYSVNTSNANISLLQTGLVELDGLTVAPVDVDSAVGTIPKGSIVGARPTVDNGGTTYVYSIDPSTFTQTLVHTVPLSVIDETLEFGPNGTLYGNNLNRSPGGSGWWAVDLFGSNHQLIGISNLRVSGSAIAPASVPEASPLVAGLLLLVTGAGVHGWKRSRPRAKSYSSF